VSSAEGTIDPDWDRWNKVVKILGGEGRLRGAPSNTFRPVSNEAYALEENGSWKGLL